MGEVHRLALRSLESSGVQKDMGGPEDSSHARMSEYPEILIMVDTHGGFHDKPSDWLPLRDVGVYPDDSGGSDWNPAGVGGIQDAYVTFFDQINESLLVVVLCRMVAWQSRDCQVSALCPLADCKADDFWRGLAKS